MWAAVAMKTVPSSPASTMETSFTWPFKSQLGWITSQATFTSTKTLRQETSWLVSNFTSRFPILVYRETSTPQIITESNPERSFLFAGCHQKPSFMGSTQQTLTFGHLVWFCGRSSALACSPFTVSATRKWWRWCGRGSCCPAQRIALLACTCWWPSAGRRVLLDGRDSKTSTPDYVLVRVCPPTPAPARHPEATPPPRLPLWAPAPVSNLSTPRYAGYIYGAPQNLSPGQIASFMTAQMPQKPAFYTCKRISYPNRLCCLPCCPFHCDSGPSTGGAALPSAEEPSPSSASGSTSTGHVTSIPSTGSNHDANTPLLSHCVTLTPMTAVPGGTMPMFGHMSQKVMQIDPSQAALLADTNRLLYSESIITADLWIHILSCILIYWIIDILMFFFLPCKYEIAWGKCKSLYFNVVL